MSEVLVMLGAVGGPPERHNCRVPTGLLDRRRHPLRVQRAVRSAPQVPQDPGWSDLRPLDVPAVGNTRLDEDRIDSCG